MPKTKSNIPHTSNRKRKKWVIVQSLLDFISRSHESIDSKGLELKLLPSQSRSTWLFSISQPMVFTETDGGGQMPKYRAEHSEVGEKVRQGEIKIGWSLNFITSVWDKLYVIVTFCQVQDGEACRVLLDLRSYSTSLALGEGKCWPCR